LQKFVLDGNMECLRCKSSMNFIKREKIQLGERGWFTGDVSHLLSGALEVDIYVCNQSALFVSMIISNLNIGILLRGGLLWK